MRFRLLLICVLLTGCTGTQGETYLGLPGSPAWFATASPQTIAAYFGDRCAAYGFQKGTPEMAQCIQQEAAGKRQSNALGAIAAANARPKTTTCNPIGSSVTCTTY